MQNNGGMNNAFTSLTDTNFHFDCSNEAFEEGLDRLAQFFISPSFSEDSAAREVEAVDSEFNQALQHDGWHQMNLMCHLANPDSCLNTFQCGNKKSLMQPEMRQSLLEFHKKWYSSNIMTLTVYSRHGLESLEAWVKSKFSAVQDKNVVLPDLGDPVAYPKEKLGRIIRFVPILDNDIMTLTWIVPYSERDIKNQPLGYFTHLFGHEGEHSLLSYLISEGLALELSAGGDHEISSFSTFAVEITLTKEGLLYWEKVIEAVFQYA